MHGICRGSRQHHSSIVTSINRIRFVQPGMIFAIPPPLPPTNHNAVDSKPVILILTFLPSSVE